MARVEPNEIKAIMPDSEMTDIQITGYITSVDVIVTNLFNGVTIGADLLKEIERWLVAHAIASTAERMAKKESAGDASIEYAGTFGSGLYSTSYGQMAVSIDNTGTLDAAAEGQKQVLFEAL